MNKPASSMMTPDATQAQPEFKSGFKEGSTMDQLARIMEPNGFAILADLVLWARLWDQCYASGTEGGKNVMEWDDANIRVLLSPFLGFGNNRRAWGVFAGKVEALIGREIPLWMGDPAYRKANSMVWCVLQSIAPSIASDTFGLKGQQDVVAILAKGFMDE